MKWCISHDPHVPACSAASSSLTQAGLQAASSHSEPRSTPTARSGTYEPTGIQPVPCQLPGQQLLEERIAGVIDDRPRRSWYSRLHERLRRTRVENQRVTVPDDHADRHILRRQGTRTEVTRHVTDRSTCQPVSLPRTSTPRPAQPMVTRRPSRGATLRLVRTGRQLLQDPVPVRKINCGISSSPAKTHHCLLITSPGSACRCGRSAGSTWRRRRTGSTPSRSPEEHAPPGQAPKRRCASPLAP